MFSLQKKSKGHYQERQARSKNASLAGQGCIVESSMFANIVLTTHKNESQDDSAVQSGRCQRGNVLRIDILRGIRYGVCFGVPTVVY